MMNGLEKILVIAIAFLIPEICFCQTPWVQKTNFPSNGRDESNSFVLNNKLYIIGGGLWKTDVWEYDPLTNSWTRKSNFPGSATLRASAFSIGNKGYYGMGDKYSDPLSTVGSKDFYEYEPTTDTWTRKADYPINITGAISFSLEGKGYICSGNANQNTAEPTYSVFEYNPLTDTWTSKANLPIAVSGGSAFTINSKAYVGMGIYGGSVDDRLFEFDPIQNTWTQKASIPMGRYNAVSFSISGTGYIGFGQNGVYTGLSDLWSYNPSSNTWSSVTSNNIQRPSGIAEVINNSAYIGLGGIAGGTMLSDLWSFSPGCDIPQSQLQGSQIVCLDNTSAFILQNYPAGSNINWTTSPVDLFVNNSGTGSTASLQAQSIYSVGSASVTFNVQSPSCNYSLTKSFWVGPPHDFLIEGPNSVIAGSSNNYIAKVWNGQPSFLDQGVNPSGILWSFGLPSTSMGWDCFNCTGETRIIKAGSLSTYVTAQSTNTCGSTIKNYEVFVQQENCPQGGCEEPFSVYPNPSYDEVTVSTNVIDKNSASEIAVIDNSGIVVYTVKTKANDIVKIPVNELKNGTFYLSIKQNGETMLRRFQINH